MNEIGRDQLGSEPKILSPQEIERRLNTVIEANPDDHRTLTYAQALYNLPDGTLSRARRILEIGMNNRLLLFRDVLRPDAELFGITLDNEHAEAARQAGRQSGFKTNVVIHNVDQGLPKGFDQMDLVLDIYSATHYAKENPVPKYVKALRPDGVLVTLPGSGFLSGIADYVRDHPEADSKEAPRITFRYIENEQVLAYADIPTIAAMLRNTAFPGLKENPTDEEIIACMTEMATKLGYKVVTNLDLFRFETIHKLEAEGLVDIKLFQTPDGMGSVGRKQKLK